MRTLLASSSLQKLRREYPAEKRLVNALLFMRCLDGSNQCDQVVLVAEDSRREEGMMRLVPVSPPMDKGHGGDLCVGEVANVSHVDGVEDICD